MKPVFLLDVDGVVCDFVGGVLKLLHMLDGVERVPAGVTEWDIMRAFGCSPEVTAQAWAGIKSEGFCYSLEPFPHAAEMVAALRGLGDVHFATTPMDGGYWHNERIDWLKQHMGAKSSDITFTARKELMRGAMLVDDKASTISAWKYANPSGRSVLWAAPYNVEAQGKELTARSYRDVLSFAAGVVQ